MEISEIGDWGLGFSKGKTIPQTLTPNPTLKGYEIHMGTSSGDIGLFRLKRPTADREMPLDGSRKNNCWGTYLHGIFENNEFRRAVLNAIREKKGLRPLPVDLDYAGLKEKGLDRLARMVRENLDIGFIERILDL